MTIPATPPRVSYEGAGGAGPFAYPFRIFAATDLKVVKRNEATGVETTLAYLLDYTVTGVGDASGNVNTTANVAIGELLVIRRATPLGQPNSIRNQGPYFASTLEDTLDRLAMQINSVQDQLDRSVGVSETYDPAGLSLRVKPEAGKVLGWDSGSTLTNKTVDSGATALPGSGRSVASVSAYLANNAVFNAKDYALGVGGAADTAAVTAAIAAAAAAGGGIAYAPFKAGGWDLTALLALADNSKVILLSDGDAAPFNKLFNGDAFAVGKQCTLQRLTLQGNGALYTGRGITVSTGAPGEVTAWRNFRDVNIYDTASYCIEYTAANSGYFSIHMGCRFRVYNSTTYAIKLPVAAETVGNRDFVGCIAPSGPFIDLDGSQDTGLIGCQSGGAVPNDAVRFTANTKKARLFGCRFAGGGGADMTVLGNDNSIVGCELSMNITLGAGCAQATIGPNNYSCSVTDNSGNNNNLVYDFGFHPFAPAWTSSGVAPALGNGTLNANYTRIGRRIFIDFEWTPGGTTTFGTGNYFFSLPAGLPGGSGREYVGNWKSLNSGVAFELGIVLITAVAPAVMTLFFPNGIGNVTNTNPHTWKNGDNMKGAINYDL